MSWLACDIRRRPADHLFQNSRLNLLVTQLSDTLGFNFSHFEAKWRSSSLMAEGVAFAANLILLLIFSKEVFGRFLIWEKLLGSKQDRSAYKFPCSLKLVFKDEITVSKTTLWTFTSYRFCWSETVSSLSICLLVRGHYLAQHFSPILHLPKQQNILLCLFHIGEIAGYLFQRGNGFHLAIFQYIHTLGLEVFGKWIC